MALIVRRFELLKQAFPGQKQPFPLLLELELGRSEPGFSLASGGCSLSLLLFDRFTLPATCHKQDYRGLAKRLGAASSPFQVLFQKTNTGQKMSCATQSRG